MRCPAVLFERLSSIERRALVAVPTVGDAWRTDWDFVVLARVTVRVDLDSSAYCDAVAFPVRLGEETECFLMAVSISRVASKKKLDMESERISLALHKQEL